MGHLPESLADDVDGLLAHGVGEGIPDQVDGDATGLLRRLTKPDVVVPASTAEPLVGGTPLERDAQGIGPGAEGERDPGRQPEPERCPNRALPTRTRVEPSSMATSKSELIPIDNTGKPTPNSAANSSRNWRNPAK